MSDSSEIPPHGEPLPGAHLHNDETLHATSGNRKYWMVFLALCVLTLCSFLTYFQWWDTAVTPKASMAFMMAVSCGKALLVMLFFMHLLWEANWKWVLTIPAAMMAIFLVCMLIPDIGLRTEQYSEERWYHAPVPHVETGETAALDSGAAH